MKEKNMDSSILDVVIQRGYRPAKVDRKMLPIILYRSIGKVAESTQYETELDQALAFWKGIRVDFYFRIVRARDSLNKAKIDNQSLEWKNFFLLRTAYLRPFLDHANPLICIVAAIESLPTPVWRRLLWHTNLDFQDFASCLRRMTPEQADALRAHANLVWESLKSGKRMELPCFTEGWKNKLWNLFSSKTSLQWDAENPLAGENTTKYEPKAAIAHNLFGWDFGFKLYSDIEKDVPNPTSLADQVVLSHRGEDFAVNTESRGTYWWLYKTLRANPFWGNPDDVKLKSHVCPGFWLTFFALVLVVIISPICLGLSVLEWPYSVQYGLATIGMITPNLFIWYGAIKLFGLVSKEYNKEFIKSTGVVIIVLLGVSFIGHGLAQVYFWLDHSEPINWMLGTLLILWTGYTSVKDKAVFPFMIPIFGPVLTAGIIGRGLWIWWEYSPETLKKVVSTIFTVILTALVVVVCVWVIGATLKKIYELAGKWIEKNIERKEKLIQEKKFETVISDTWKIQIISNGVLLSAVSMFGWIGYQLYIQMSGGNFTIHRDINTMGLFFGALMFVVIQSTIWAVFVKQRKKFNSHETEENYLIQLIGQERIGYVFPYPQLRTILANPTFRTGFCSFRMDLIRLVLESKNVSKVGNSILKRITEENLKRLANTRTRETYLLSFMASGMRRSEAREAYQKQKQKAFEKAKRKEVNSVRMKKMSGLLNTFFSHLIDVLTFLPKIIIKGIVKIIGTVVMLKETFDNHCPRVYKS